MDRGWEIFSIPFHEVMLVFIPLNSSKVGNGAKFRRHPQHPEWTQINVHTFILKNFVRSIAHISEYKSKSAYYLIIYTMSDTAMCTNLWLAEWNSGYPHSTFHIYMGEKVVFIRKSYMNFYFAWFVHVYAYIRLSSI